MDRAGGERGATAITYALMVAIVALLLVGGFFALGGSIQTALDDGAACVLSPSDCGDGPGSGGGDDGGNGGGGGGATTSTRTATTTGPTTTSTTTGP